MSLMCAIQLGIPDVLHNNGKPIALFKLATSFSIPQSKTPPSEASWVCLSTPSFSQVTETKEGEKKRVFSSRNLETPGERGEGGSIAVRANDIELDPAGTGAPAGEVVQGRAAGATPFDMAHGKGLFGEMDVTADSNERFNEGMASDARLVTEVVLLRPWWELLRVVRSVGDLDGGTGVLAKAIQGVARGAVPGAGPAACGGDGRRRGVGGRVEFTRGDMIEHIPPADCRLTQSTVTSQLEKITQFAYHNILLSDTAVTQKNH